MLSTSRRRHARCTRRRIRSSLWMVTSIFVAFVSAGVVTTAASSPPPSIPSALPSSRTKIDGQNTLEAPKGGIIDSKTPKLTTTDNSVAVVGGRSRGDSSTPLEPVSSTGDQSSQAQAAVNRDETAKISVQDKVSASETILEDGGGKKKKKQKKSRSLDTSKSASSTASVRSSTAGTQESACLRRIKREWKNAVKSGIAYDWMRMETIVRRKQLSADGSAAATAPPSDASAHVRIGPYGKNLLQWRFSVLGAPSSDFENGIYHGRVLLPRDYPGSPPRIQVLTPSGRFISGHDICLSASSYHPESWTPRWTVESLVNALRLHMLTSANEIGGLDATPAQRRRLAKASRYWASGSVDHLEMIRQGVFRSTSEEEEQLQAFADTTTESQFATSAERRKRRKKKRADSSSDTAGAVASVAGRRNTPEAGARVIRPKRSTTLMTQVVRATVEILTRRPRVVLLLLLTVIVVLNNA